MVLSPWRKFLVCGPHPTENQNIFLDYGPRRTENRFFLIFDLGVDVIEVVGVTPWLLVYLVPP
jgi:hypothetical protein